VPSVAVTVWIAVTEVDPVSIVSLVEVTVTVAVTGDVVVSKIVLVSVAVTVPPVLVTTVVSVIVEET
jgi:hypothetical protein